MPVVISLKRTYIFFQMRGAESAGSSRLVAVRHPWCKPPCTQPQWMTSVHHSAGEVGPDALLVLLFMLVPRINSVNSSKLLKIALDEYLAG